MELIQPVHRGSSAVSLDAPRISAQAALPWWLLGAPPSPRLAPEHLSLFAVQAGAEIETLRVE